MIPTEMFRVLLSTYLNHYATAIRTSYIKRSSRYKSSIQTHKSMTKYHSETKKRDKDNSKQNTTS